MGAGGVRRRRLSGEIVESGAEAKLSLGGIHDGTKPIPSGGWKGGEGERRKERGEGQSFHISASRFRLSYAGQSQAVYRSTRPFVNILYEQ